MIEQRLDMPPHIHKRLLDRMAMRDCAIFAFGWAVFVFAAWFFGGCHTYTVVPADYHAVPVRQTGEATYEHAVEDATGWYIPDSLMLELLDAR